MLQDNQEIHDKSPVESVEEFFAWMHKKARGDGGVVRGRVDEVVYEIDDNPESLLAAIEKYKNL